MSEAAKKMLKKMEKNDWNFYTLESRLLSGKFKTKEDKEGALELLKIWRD